MGNLTLVIGLAILVVSCQKQQDATVTTPTDAAVIKNIAGSGYNGKISSSDAQEMYNTYKGTTKSGATEYVSFSIADLKAYLAALEAAGKTDLVNVNLAVYNDKTASDPSLIGRTTIFFGPGAPKSRTRNGGRTDFGVTVAFDANADYMNHGQIWP